MEHTNTTILFAFALVATAACRPTECLWERQEKTVNGSNQAQQRRRAVQPGRESNHRASMMKPKFISYAGWPYLSVLVPALLLVSEPSQAQPANDAFANSQSLSGSVGSV